MDITIRIFTKINGHTNSRTILLNEGELDNMIEEYLYLERYLKDKEELLSITYENVKL